MGHEADPAGAVSNLLSEARDGRIKLYLTSRLLRHRRAHPALFLSGSYQPLYVTGDRADAVCAFERKAGDEALVVAACLQPAQVTGGREVAPLWAGLAGVRLSCRSRRVRWEIATSTS